LKIASFVAACALAAVVVAGCSSSSKSTSSSSNPTTTVAKQAVCTARAQLQQSVTALADPALLTQGKSAIQSQLDTVKTNLDAVSSTAGDVYKPQVDAVKSAIQDLESALGKLGNGNLSANLQAVGTAIAKVGSTSATLVTTLQTACP